jgi:pimeloyl-ACP methyl ester carboxylesterase
VLAAVERAAPSGAEAEWTAEVDVVGASLGGLVARYAAAPPQSSEGNRKRLRIARLFTISSPHDGANLAESVALTQFHRDLRPNSAFLRRLAESDPHPTYELYPYVHLGDEIVGEQHAAPAGTNPLWLSNPPLAPAHLSAMLDERILADISRRLRGEEPLSHPPSPPLPGAGDMPSPRGEG